MTCEIYLVRLPVCSRTNLLPCRGSASEVPVCLGHLQWFYDDSLLLLVVANLGVSGHWEVLPQWVTVEAVICHYPSQIGMAGEEDAEEVVDFALVPIGTIVESAKRRYRCGLISVGLHPYAGVVSDGKKIVNDLEALVLGGIVYSSDV